MDDCCCCNILEHTLLVSQLYNLMACFSVRSSQSRLTVMPNMANMHCGDKILRFCEYDCEDVMLERCHSVLTTAT